MGSDGHAVMDIKLGHILIQIEFDILQAKCGPLRGESIGHRSITKDQ